MENANFLLYLLNWYKIIMWWLIFLLYDIICVFLPVVFTQLPMFHQDDYIVKFERFETVWFNKTHVRDVYVDFPWFNRTNRVLNTSGHLLMEETTNDITGELQLYKFLSNEYRFFPLSVGGNLCEEYNRNRFNAQNLLKDRSNFHGCPLRKGFHYAYNIPINVTSELPPYMPRGRFKIQLKLFYKTEFVAEGGLYGEVKDKPLNWNIKTRL